MLVLVLALHVQRVCWSDFNPEWGPFALEDGVSSSQTSCLCKGQSHCQLVNEWVPGRRVRPRVCAVGIRWHTLHPLAVS